MITRYYFKQANGLLRDGFFDDKAYAESMIKSTNRYDKENGRFTPEAEIVDVVAVITIETPEQEISRLEEELFLDEMRDYREFGKASRIEARLRELRSAV